jgi:hypothetical protein
MPDDGRSELVERNRRPIHNEGMPPLRRALDSCMRLLRLTRPRSFQHLLLRGAGALPACLGPSLQLGTRRRDRRWVLAWGNQMGSHAATVLSPRHHEQEAGLGFSPGLRMATPPPRKRDLSPKASRALAMLANRPLGVAEALLLARGFSRRMLLGLIRRGLVTVTYESGRAGGKMRITGAGRVALSGLLRK